MAAGAAGLSHIPRLLRRPSAASSKMDVSSRLLNVANFLSSPFVASFFALHPNQLASDAFLPPSQWSSWWNWAAEPEAHWDQLLDYYDLCYARQLHIADPHGEDMTPGCSSQIPRELQSMISEACRLALPRTQGGVFPTASHPEWNFSEPSSRPQPGMSPKKAHEVAYMASNIAQLLSSTPELARVRHVVDVGAGQVRTFIYRPAVLALDGRVRCLTPCAQAYLSRALRDDLGVHVLALDWSDVQTNGAKKREEKPNKAKGRRTPVVESQDSTRETQQNSDANPSGRRSRVSSHTDGSMTYVTTKITAERLVEEVDDWVRDNEHFHAPQRGSAVAGDTPVVFVALHACGSLTPDAIRAFLAARARPDTSWIPQAAVLVGCCYNMMSADGALSMARTVLPCWSFLEPSLAPQISRCPRS